MGGSGGKRAKIRRSKAVHLDGVRNEINVTPLVDVCLVLLIIFMVVTPMLARGKEVPLPKTLNHATENDKNQPIVAMDRDGQLYYDKEAMATVEQLKDRIEGAWRADPEIPTRVLFKGDKDLPYEQVYPVIIAIHELGVVSIDLGTNEQKDNE